MDIEQTRGDIVWLWSDRAEGVEALVRLVRVGPVAGDVPFPT